MCVAVEHTRTYAHLSRWLHASVFSTLWLLLALLTAVDVFCWGGGAGRAAAAAGQLGRGAKYAGRAHQMTLRGSLRHEKPQTLPCRPPLHAVLLARKCMGMGVGRLLLRFFLACIWWVGSTAGHKGRGSFGLRCYAGLHNRRPIQWPGSLCGRS